MKINGITGIFNSHGFNPLNNDSLGPQNLEVVYKDENEKLYMQYLDSGDFPLLIARLTSIKDKKEKEIELEKYLTGGEIAELGYKYRSIENRFFYSNPIILDEDFSLSYISLQNCSPDKIEIEPFAITNPYNNAVIVESQKIFIGTFQYIYEKLRPYLNIEGKSVEEIKIIINWLIQNMYLEEAYNLIMNVQSHSINLEEYRHPKNLFVTDGTTNFLDSSLNKIENLNFVKEQTKSLNLKIFQRI